MIRVLLLDDDRLALEGLKSLLPWEKYGMSVIGEAVGTGVSEKEQRRSCHS